MGFAQFVSMDIILLQIVVLNVRLIAKLVLMEQLAFYVLQDTFNKLYQWGMIYPQHLSHQPVLLAVQIVKAAVWMQINVKAAMMVSE